ncbi:MAG: A/G-specific adenine glycosylase [Acidimicrobiales bacterium]
MGLTVARARTPVDRVLAWWLPSDVRRERDRLPWRSPPAAPWGVLVSETMLAQTQASRVAERYPQFMARFATPSILARAPLGEVLQTWQGLGYPRRAAGLHRSAGAIVADHNGEVPSDLASLLALPGVGRYIARAVLAFAFDQPTMPVDTNIGRVLARAVGRRLLEPQAQAVGDGVLAGGDLALDGQAAKGRATKGRATKGQEVGGPAVRPLPGAGLAALAFMDLGATLCRPAVPRCPECPLQPDCRWARAVSAATGELPPDPARGSARVSKPQAPFEGSDRQGRGRLLRAAAAGPVSNGDLADAAGWPEDPARATRVAATLVTDGLLRLDDGSYSLP